MPKITNLNKITPIATRNAPKKMKRFRLLISGPSIQCSFSSLTPALTDHWSNRPIDELYNHTFGYRDDESESPDDGTPADMQLAEWRSFPNATTFEGTSADESSFSVINQKGKELLSERMIYSDVQERYICDRTYHNDYSIIRGSAGAYLGATRYEGDLEYSFSISGEFDPDLLKFGWTMVLSEGFITSATYDGVPLEFEGGTGPTTEQIVQMYARNEKGHMKVKKHRDSCGYEDPCNYAEWSAAA